MLVQFWEIGQLWTPATFTESISTWSWEITSPKNSICYLLNLYFLGQRNNLCLFRTSKTLYTTLWCSSSVWVKIRISFRYTIIMHSAVRSQKMSFIMVWKVARLLVISKNITRGSKRPQLVQKVAFHSSLCLIQTLLKPQWTSNLVKYLDSWSWDISLEIRESRYLFLTITTLRLL